MPDVSLADPPWEPDRADLPGRHHARVGAAAGASDLGAGLYVLDPGVTGCPLHAHHANEELLVVLDGRPSLRTPGGTRVLGPGDVVAFPRGTAGAHQVSNATDEPVRYLVVSTTDVPDVVAYPDTGASLVVLDEETVAVPAGAVGDRAQVVRDAFAAARDAVR